MNLIIFIGIFAGFMAVAVLLSWVVAHSQKKRLRMLSVITKDQALGLKKIQDGKQEERQKIDITKKLKDLSSKEKTDSSSHSIPMLLLQAGFENTTMYQFWLYSFLLALTIGIILFGFMHVSRLVLILTTIIILFGIPRTFLKIKADRRQRKFLEEFPDALDAAVRLLQAGMPITEAVSMASREFIGPLREEMQRIYDNQKIGIPIGSAALETARRIPLTEVYMFATALQIQSETGSSLSEVLTNLSTIIRARFKLKRKVRALSSEAKASAMIIGALPILVTFGLYCANPQYISLLYTTDSGRMLAVGACCWMAIGIFIMKQMINFRI